MIIWVVGAGGLFGSAVIRCARSRGDHVVVSSKVPWANPAEAEAHLREDRDRFTALVDSQAPSQPWSIIWSAGAATTASPSATFEAESHAFERFMAVFSSGSPQSSRGRMLLVSSAGGVYAGSARAPFTAATPPVPIGDYGRLKLHQEETARRILELHMDLVVARISNLYGPGQDLGKIQGVISQLCSAGITKQPLSIFVSLDTLRDFIYVDDAARLALHWLDVAEPGVTTRVIASGTSTSLGHVIALVNDIVRARVPVAYGLHPSASAQARDIRLVPDRDIVTDALASTPLPVGIQAVYLDLLARHATGSQRLTMSLG